jgi:hypothetical protein
MKNISIFIITCFTSLFSYATVITVNNNTNSPGQYTSLQTAVNAAANGDSIYVHGSATSYGSVVVKKRLTLLGTGSNPNKTNKLVSQISNIQLDTTANTSGASGTKIIGFTLTSIYGYGGAGGTKNITIGRNYFASGGTKIVITGKDWTIENNIIEPSLINVNNNANTIIRNNIFDGSNILSSSQPTVVIANNIFLGNSPFTAMSLVSNALIANNIFSGSSPKETGVNNNVFNNNITYQTVYDTIPFGTNTGTGNLVATDPQYTNVPSNTFSYNYDFSLKSTSLGKNAGTDSTDIGVFGGARPFVDMTGAPAIPQLKSISILNPVIPVGDSLRVIIKANKQN